MNMTAWAWNLTVVVVALWAATCAADQALSDPFSAVVNYFRRLAAFRPFRIRDYRGLTWAETQRYRQEAVFITVVSLILLTILVPLASSWGIVVQLGWLGLASRLVYSRLIRGQSGTPFYLIVGALLLVGLAWSVLFWLFWTDKYFISRYWYAIMAIGMLWPLPSGAHPSSSEAASRA